MTILVEPNDTNATQLRARADMAETNVEAPWPFQVPFSIPRAQTYYWSARWQRAERDSLADLAAGDYVEFASDDPDDVIRWLQSSDD